MQNSTRNTWDRAGKAKLVQEKLSPQDLLRRFRFDFEKGEIYTRKTGNRVDRIHTFNGHTRNLDLAYRQVSLKVPDLASVKPITVKLSAHVMIWTAANGRWPREGMVIDHRDGKRQNNAVSNLEEVSQAENVRRGRR